LVVPVDPTLLAAVVSAIVAFAVLGLDKFFIEPRKWLNRYHTRVDEEAIGVHSWLISILKACREKAKRQIKEGSKPAQPHLLESADIWKLEEIFEKKAYLLSDALKRTWYDLQKHDKSLELTHVRYRDEVMLPTIKTPTIDFHSPPMRYNVIAVDLTSMEKQAEDDLASLQGRYERMTGFRLAF
jgi:hypothetical protein